MTHSATIAPILSFDDFVGQDALKRRLKMSIAGAKNKQRRLGHVLLATNMPGVGKTTLAHIIAAEMGVKIVEVFGGDLHAEDVANLSDRLDDGDILFIDEAHKLVDKRKANAEFLLKLLESGQVPVGGELIQMPDITVILASTNADRLPEPVLDRIDIRPSFDRYNAESMERITLRFAERYEVKIENPDLIKTIAGAARFTPRVVGNLIKTVRDMQDALGEDPAPEELLDMEELTADGLGLEHRNYLLALLKQKRTNGRGETVCELGQAALMSAIRVDFPALAKIERYLIDMDYVARTSSGRALTSAGMTRAAELRGA